jgi:single-strand DNA-binding protein
MSVTSTPITVVGRVVTDITPRMTQGGHKVANFRIATQERTYDKAQDLGDQIVVHGRMKIREYTTEEGARRTDLEVDAKAIGPDLALHTVSVNRPDWAISPHQQTLLKPPPDQLFPSEEVTREEAAQAA